MINIADVSINNVDYPLENMTIKCAESVGFNYKGFHKMLLSGNRWGSLNKKAKKYTSVKYEKIFIFYKP